jgi:hypothetical protein
VRQLQGSVQTAFVKNDELVMNRVAVEKVTELVLAMATTARL